MSSEPTTRRLVGPVADNTAMSYLLEQVRDNPGAISPYAASGAAQWALGRIEWLEMVIRSAREDVHDSPDEAYLVLKHAEVSYHAR